MDKSAVTTFIPCHPPLIQHFIDIRQLRPPFHSFLHYRYAFPLAFVMASSACAVHQDCHILLLQPIHHPAAAFGTAPFPWGRDIYHHPVSLVPLANIAILASISLPSFLMRSDQVVPTCLLRYGQLQA